LRSGSSNCCCRLLLEKCIVCADFSYTSRDKRAFFRCWGCIRVHRRAWHHSINWNGSRNGIIVLKRRGDSRPLGDKKKKRDKGTPKKISNRSGRSPANPLVPPACGLSVRLGLSLSLSLYRPTGLFLTNPVCTAVLCCGEATSQQHSISGLPIQPSFCPIRGDKSMLNSTSPPTFPTSP
jgi:hypothetical protein